MSSRFKSIVALVSGVALPFLLFALVALITSGQRSQRPILSDFGDVPHKIDVLLAHINFVNAWSLAVMGGLTVLGIKLLEMGRWNSATRQILFTGFGLLAASLYAGHESRLAILNAYLGGGSVTFGGTFIDTMTWLQAFGLLAGCLAFPTILGLQACQTALPPSEVQPP